MKFAEYAEGFDTIAAALAAARTAGYSVNKFSDPCEGERLGLGIAEALGIAQEDVNLLWLGIDDEGCLSAEKVEVIEKALGDHYWTSSWKQREAYFTSLVNPGGILHQREVWCIRYYGEDDLSDLREELELIGCHPSEAKVGWWSDTESGIHDGPFETALEAVKAFVFTPDY